jgi:hypothetical protein
MCRQRGERVPLSGLVAPHRLGHAARREQLLRWRPDRRERAVRCCSALLLLLVLLVLLVVLMLWRPVVGDEAALLLGEEARLIAVDPNLGLLPAGIP